jgi:hypothetical protein
LFINKTPQEQFKELYEVNSKVISPIAKSIFRLLLNMDKRDFYKQKMLNDKKEVVKEQEVKEEQQQQEEVEQEKQDDIFVLNCFYQDAYNERFCR